MKVILWRMSNYKSLDGIGGLLTAGRWHSKGHPVIYCALNPATALVEALVHLEIDAEDRPAHLKVLQIDAPTDLSLRAIQIPDLPANWRTEARLLKIATTYQYPFDDRLL